jgi:hypothetical protein
MRISIGICLARLIFRVGCIVETTMRSTIHSSTIRVFVEANGGIDHLSILPKTHILTGACNCSSV